jgi:signal transduction histidine kinase
MSGLERNIWKRIWTWSSARTLSAVTVGAALLTVVLMQLEFNLLEANLYDFRMSKGPQSRPRSDIVLIAVDDPSAKQLNDFSPLPLDQHARLIEKLETLSPKAIGYLVPMNRVVEANPDLISDRVSTRFVEAADRLESKNIPVVLGTPFDVTGEVIPPYPLSALHHSVAVIHKDGNVFSEDKITRRALTYLYDKPVFHLELAQRLGVHPEGFRPRGNFAVPEVESEYFFFRYHGNPSRNPKHPEREPYRIYSFADVLNDQLPPETFTDKIVLVGTLSREDSNDFVFTPYGKQVFSTPKLVVHATIVDSILNNDGILRAPTWMNWIATFCVTAAVIAWVLKLTPLYGVFATIALALAYGLTAQLLFSWKGIWIRESQPLVGIFLGYYLVVPYRLIREYKQRWDYQRKNELLLQVEELKTNFVSLVTHDLKTPVARIQGLAEVLMRKARERLLDRDLETLHHIIASTDELNRFITSILELNKVESNRLQLRFESKDINMLMERAVESFKPSAKAKKIALQSNLEPLFPIRIDVELVSKIINNLIDNALKYSPEGSVVSIESREVHDQWVEISVSDQGIGMSEEELKQLFTRFYRAKNDTTVRSPGTGLGLYLTKYFVEAHYGRVEVESVPGQGSRFKILLPPDPSALPLAVKAQGLKFTLIKEKEDVQNSRRG